MNKRSEFVLLADAAGRLDACCLLAWFRGHKTALFSYRPILRCNNNTMQSQQQQQQQQQIEDSGISLTGIVIHFCLDFIIMHGCKFSSCHPATLLRSCRWGKIKQNQLWKKLSSVIENSLSFKCLYNSNLGSLTA